MANTPHIVKAGRHDILYTVVLHRANLDEALASIALAMNITDPEWAAEAAPDARDWKRMNDAQRLQTLASILTAHCFNLIDQGNVLVSTDRIPMNTVGTND